MAAVALCPTFGVGYTSLLSNGSPNALGKIWTYEAGTSTPATTYQDAGGTTPLANPIILDGTGRVTGGEIWIQQAMAYKFVVEDVNGNQVGPPYDNIATIGAGIQLNVDTGAVNAIAIAPTPGIWALAAGMEFSIKVAYTPTGAVTVNVSGLGAKALLGGGGTPIGAGDFAAGDIISVEYDGTQFYLQSGRSSASSGPGDTPFALRNRIINGDMRVAQRGTSFAAPATASYTLDRWMVSWAGAATAVAQVAAPAGVAAIDALQITGAAGNTNAAIQQRIESVNIADLAGLSVTFQANLTASVAQTVQWNLQTPTAIDNYSATTVIASGTWNVGTAPGVYTATAVLPASAANGLQLLIAANNGGAFTSGTLTITDVQLEPGTVATPFERRPIGLERELCEWYYRYSPALSRWSYWTGNGNSWCDPVVFPTMRTIPSVAVSGQTYQNCTSVLISPNTAQNVTVQTGGNTSGYVAYASFNLALSAEL